MEKHGKETFIRKCVQVALLPCISEGAVMSRNIFNAQVGV